MHYVVFTAEEAEPGKPESQASGFTSQLCDRPGRGGRQAVDVLRTAGGVRVT